MNFVRQLPSVRSFATQAKNLNLNTAPAKPKSDTLVPFLKMAIASRPSARSLPCVLMRAGTSKGLFIHRKDLPEREIDWGSHLISALGSRGCDPRQVDGIGGGTSTTSKVAVVSPSTRPGIDVEFTFVQVAVGKESVDLSGNCGNMVSGVGPFAVQEGLVEPVRGESYCDVRVYNTNTERVIVETVQIDQNGQFIEEGDYSIPGVSTSGSEVKVAFVDPAGSMTGKLFPSGERQEMLLVVPRGSHGEFEARVTLIDAANPFVLVDATAIASILQGCSAEEQDELLESIRLSGAVKMGLAPDIETASKTRGTPKVALLYPPIFSDKDADIRTVSYSMGKPHPSLQLTGAVCLAAALRLKGTVAAELSQKPVLANSAPPTPERTPSPVGSGTDSKPNREKGELHIAHSKGTIRVDIAMGIDEKGEEKVSSCAVSRTARRLFEGNVRYYV